MLGIADLVVHPGAHMGSGEEAGFGGGAALDQIHRRTDGLECLDRPETTAGQGSSSGIGSSISRRSLASSKNLRGSGYASTRATFLRRAIPWIAGNGTMRP